MTMDLVLYGPLLDPELRRAIVGDVPDGRPFTLEGEALVALPSSPWPVAVQTPRGRLDGVVVSPDADARERCARYMRAMGAVAAHVGAGADAAEFWRVPGQGDHPEWSLRDWQARWGPLERRVARDVLSWPAEADLAFRVPTLRQRISSSLRAGIDPPPRRLRADIHRDAIEVRHRREPYVAFFAVNETDLAHPRFAGRPPAEINRAALVGGDAVAVLPYDAARDRVMVIEQFRFGPFTRGDLYPWTLEPIAGRIDPGETPEAAARREAVEEAGLTLDRLIDVGPSYPSPGQLSEFLYAFVAPVALPDEAAGLGGLDAENEDIRAHVVSFDEMMTLISTGEINSMPLMLCAFWLDRARREGSFA